MARREPLILVPGLSCDDALWSAQRTDLADIADIRIADTLQDDSIAAMATRLLDNAPPRFAIAGLSMGGYVTMEVWRRAPQRVSRLALLDTSARADTADQIRLREAAIHTARERGFEKVLRGSLSQLVHDDASGAVFDAVVEMASRVGFETYVRQQQAIMNRIDSRADLTGVDVPALVLVGDTDRLTPPDLAMKMAQAIPGAVYREMPRCGHMASMERPAEVTTALREWLAA